MKRSGAKGGITLVVRKRGCLFFSLATEKLTAVKEKQPWRMCVCTFRACFFFSGLVTNSLVTIDTPTHSPSPISQPSLPPPPECSDGGGIRTPLPLQWLKRPTSRGQPLQPHHSFLYELEPRATSLATCTHVVLDPRSFFSSFRTCRMGVTPEVT